MRWLCIVGLVGLASGCGRRWFDELAAVDSSPSDAAGGGDGPRPDAPPTDAWWDTAWTGRFRIRFHNSTEALANVVVPVRLEERFGPARALRFVDAAGVRLSHEVEVAKSLGVAWVRVPSILLGSDSYIWLYYGNAAAVASEAPAEVWPSTEYALVMHGTGDFAAVTGAISFEAVDIDSEPGLWGDGWRTNGSTSSLTIADDAAYRGSPRTISIWSRPIASVEDYQAVLTRPHATRVQENDMWLGYHASNCNVEMYTSNVQMRTAGCAAADGVRQHALVTAATSSQAYVNGEQFYMVNDQAITQSAKPLIVGADLNVAVGEPESDFFNGIIDELRIEHVARSQGWLRALVAMRGTGFCSVE